MPMTNEKILSAVTECRRMLRSAYPSVEPERALETMPAVSPLRAAKHLLWMCEWIPKVVGEGSVEAAARRLAFIQGALWLGNYATLEQLKKMNMPDPAPTEQAAT